MQHNVSRVQQFLIRVIEWRPMKTVWLEMASQSLVANCAQDDNSKEDQVGLSLNTPEFTPTRRTASDLCLVGSPVENKP